MTDAFQYTIPSEPGRWRALTLAAAVHVALFTFLWIGVRWQNETPVTIEAEVWSPQPREAAPPLPEPEPKPEIKPEPKEVPKPVVVEPPVVKPDIALEQEKKRKEKERQARDDAARLEKQKADTQRIEKEKNEAKAKRDAETAKKQTADKKRQQDELEAKKLADERAKEMHRIAGSGGSGEAAKREGISGDPGYANKIAAKIKSNTIFNVPENLAGNPSVEYAIELLPDGSVRQPIRKRKPSGVPGFDEAVLNAIEKSQPFPPDKSGRVPSSVTIIHRPKDSNQ